MDDERKTPTPPDALDTMARRFSAAAEQYATSEQRAGDDLDAVVAAVAAIRPAFVIDVATGPGSTALALATVADRVLGTDVSEGMVATATRRAAEIDVSDQVSFRVADAVHLPAADGEVDAVTCRIAAHHFADVPAAIAEAARVLRPGGRFVLLDSEAPDDPEVAAFLHELETGRDPTHVRAFTRQEWVAMIEAAGFTVVSVGSYPKPKAFEPWLERGGIDESEQAGVRDLVRDAPPAARRALAIEFDDAGAPARFADDKVLVVAEKVGHCDGG